MAAKFPDFAVLQQSVEGRHKPAYQEAEATLPLDW